MQNSYNDFDLSKMMSTRGHKYHGKENFIILLKHSPEFKTNWQKWPLGDLQKSLL